MIRSESSRTGNRLFVGASLASPDDALFEICGISIWDKHISAGLPSQGLEGETRSKRHSAISYTPLGRCEHTVAMTLRLCSPACNPRATAAAAVRPAYCESAVSEVKNTARVGPA